jgi:hypothetical protein
MADQASEINDVLAEMKTFTDDQLYTGLSEDDTEKYRKYVYEAAERSLSDEDRTRMKNWPGAGLYGPISAVFGRLEDKYQFDIMRARAAQPNVEQGRHLFSSNWKLIQDKICNDWNYCKKKKEFADENKLLISIVALVLAGTSWHLRTAIAVVLLAWHQGPKFMCACPDEGSEGTTPQSSESSAAQGPGQQDPKSATRARRPTRRAPRRRD